MKNAIELKGVTKEYKNFKLDKINLKIQSGCIMGLVGENGAGKTTLIKAVLNMLNRDAGEIFIDGKESESEQWKTDEIVGVVFDQCYFPEDADIKAINVIMKNIYKKWQPDMFQKYAIEFGLSQGKLIKDFSKGMKMKLSIAVALSHQAQILIMDEATSGLDPIIRDELLEILLEFIQDESHTVLFSSHIISDLEKIADYITFLHRGKIVFTESRDKLKYQYGIVKCNGEEAELIPQSHIVGIRKNQFSMEVMVKDRACVQKINSNFVIDDASIEDIILFKIKGEKL